MAHPYLKGNIFDGQKDATRAQRLLASGRAALERSLQSVDEPHIQEQLLECIKLFVGPKYDSTSQQRNKSLGVHWYHRVQALCKSYKSTSNLRLLGEATNMARELLLLCPVGHPDRANACAHLAHILAVRYESSKDDQLLIESIDLERESLDLRPPGHAERALSRGNLAISLHERYKHAGDAQLLTEVIGLEREFLALCPSGHPDRAQACADLASSLQKLHECTWDDELLNEAIALERECLALRPQGHVQRAFSSTNLASSLWMRYNSTGNENLLTEAIDLERESLNLCPPGHPNRALACANLASTLRLRFDSTEDDHLLTEVVYLQRESLALRPPGHPERARSCGNLANSLRARYTTTGDRHLVTEAIQLDQEAVSLRPPGHSYRPISCTNLASSLLLLYDITMDNELLIEAIHLERECLALRPVGHPDRPRTCGGLASSLLKRFERTQDERWLTEAIDLQRESLTLCRPGHPDRVVFCGNLAYSLQMSYYHNGNDILLDEIQCHGQEGLSVAKSGTRWRYTMVLAWLGLLPRTKYFDIAAATQHLDQSLSLHPDDVSSATSRCIQCLDLWWRNLSDCRPSQLMQLHCALGPVYQKLIRLLPFLGHPVLDISSQLQALQSCHHLGSEASVNAILSGQWTLGVEELEVVQGLCWSRHLNYRDPQLERIPVELAARLDSLLKSIAAPPPLAEASDLPRSPLTSRDIHHSNITRLRVLLDQVRALPGLGRFMLGETFDVLRSTATSHPVIVLVTARGHSYAFVISSKSNQCISLSLDWDRLHGTAPADIQGAARSHRGASVAPAESYEKAGDDRGFRIKPIHYASLVHDRMRYIWIRVVKPVLETLGLKPSNGRDRPRLHWYPTGAFTTLPLHAAGIYDGPVESRACCSDYVVSSYTPTLTTLLRAQRNLSPIRRESTQIVLVAQKQAHELNMEIIYHVDIEVDRVAAITQSRNVHTVRRLSSPVTIAQTCGAMQTANVVHLACHGIQDSDNALESGFCLEDGRLTIAELMKFKLDNPFLAFLSACETAKGDAKQPDQLMHLAAAMIFLGFKSVVATMWAISDIDGPTVAQGFYEALLLEDMIDENTTAYALDQAVGKLRKSGVSIDRWAPFIHMGA